MKLGVVDVGGGLRDIYGAGVLDGCMDRGVHFDLCIGVSAGSANLASYMAHQRGRNFVYYTEYALRKEYMSLENVKRLHSYIDLEYPYATLSNSGGEDPLDYETLANDPGELLVVASDAQNGKAKYFTKADLSQDHYDPFKASCALPFICKPYPIGGRYYYDGALSDPVPIQKALDLGCDKVVLILTKPKNVFRTVGKDEFFARRVAKKYPHAARNLRLRAQRYNQGVFLAKKLAAEGKVFIAAPADTCGMDTLTRDKDAMVRLYGLGLADAAAIPEFLNAE